MSAANTPGPAVATSDTSAPRRVRSQHASFVQRTSASAKPVELPADNESGNVLYRFLGRFLGDELVLSEQSIQPSVEQRIVELESRVADSSCPGTEEDGIGVAELPARIPVELAAWLALANLHQQEGGTSQAGVCRAGELPGFETSHVVARDVLTFAPETGIECKLQTKVFRTQTDTTADTSPSDRSVEPEWKREEEFGLRWRQRGDFAWELLAAVEDGGKTYVLNLLLTNEAEARQGDGEWTSVAMRCVSRRMLLVDGLGAYAIGVSPTAANEQRTCVWRKEAGETK